MVDMQNFTWAVDISHWWHIDWTQVPDFIQMALIKVTEGDHLVDECFQQHVEDALKAGKMVGLYHAYRSRIRERRVAPKAQADFFLHHTQPYWDDVSLRANSFVRGKFLSTAGEYFNPRLGSESNDLFDFHQKLHRSDWLAFDLLYTNMPTWQGMKLEDPADLWQGPGWIKDQPFINGLWLAWYPYRRPRGPQALGEFVPTSFSPRLPHPFSSYWAWQFSADFPLRGLYTKDGLINEPANLSVVPYPPGVVAEMLAAYDLGEEDALEVQKTSAAYRTGWFNRPGRQIEKLSLSGGKEVE